MLIMDEDTKKKIGKKKSIVYMDTLEQVHLGEHLSR